MKMTNTAKKQRLERVKKYAAEVALWLVKDLEDALAQPDLVKAAKAREAVGLHKVAIQCSFYDSEGQRFNDMIVSNWYYLTEEEINILRAHIRKKNTDLYLGKRATYTVAPFAKADAVDLPLALYEAKEILKKKKLKK